MLIFAIVFVTMTLIVWPLFKQNNPHSKHANAKIFLAVISDKTTEDRTQIFDKFYREHFLTNEVYGPVYFYSDLSPEVNPQNYPVTQIKTDHLASQTTVRPFIYDLLKKFIVSLEYFVHETNADWMIRPTDDVYLNPRNWPGNLLQKLENFSDPANKPYFLGDCRITDGHKRVHGGSGPVISRAAAKLILQGQNELFLKPATKWEDFILPEFVEKNLGLKEYCMPGISGYEFPKPLYDQIMLGNYSKIPLCEDVYEESEDVGCSKGMQSLKDIVIWHQYWSRTDPLIKNMHYIISIIPSHIMWYRVKEGIKLCSNKVVI